MTDTDPTKKLRQNLGTRPLKRLKSAVFPDAGQAASGLRSVRRNSLDVLLVNPPSPDGGIWIRTQHRVGRRSREEMVWPQCSLAQLAALLEPEYKVEIVDAIAERMSWESFEALLRARNPRYYLTHVTAPTLTNDMYGAMLARSLGARTIAFGTHVTPMYAETMRDYPALDFVLRGEPELTLRELIDTCEGHRDRPDWFRRMSAAQAEWQPSECGSTEPALCRIRGLVWREDGEIRANPDRPFFPRLDDLPMPRHDLLPLDKYRMPLLRGPFSFVVTSRGCPAGCTYCIKHVSYQNSVRLHSPGRIVEEMKLLLGLGVRNIHMYADLFTVNREQVVGICREILKEKLQVRWTCNSRVDYVDAEMLKLMGRAGCWLISWGIESGSEAVLKQARKGASAGKARRALEWSRQAGIKNWGYFIIGLPGETVETIRETIELSKVLPLDIALFHIAAPYPGTPFFFQVLENGWFKPGTRWEQVDMDKETVLSYQNLSPEELVYWQRRAFREWAFRPGPAWTYFKMLCSNPRTFRQALRVGREHLELASKSFQSPRRGH